MERLLQIWNARPERETVRGRAAQGLMLFFAFLLCCTLVSRAADSLTVPTVETAAPKRMALSHVLELDGTLEPADKTPVFAPENMRIVSVAVAVGDEVRAGDLLFTFDTADTQQAITAKSLELTKLELELDEIEQNAKLEREKNETALGRAFDDYESQAESASFRVKAARDAMNRARHDMREWERDSEVDSGTQYEALRDTYLEKKQLYEQAQLEEKQALAKAGRGIEDAVPERYTREKERKQTDIEAKRLEIAALQKELSAGGAVYAPADAQIASVKAEAGKRFDGGAAMELAAEGVRFCSELTETEKAEISRGGTVTLKLPNGKEQPCGPVRLRPVAGKSGVYRMEADTAEGETGMAVTAVVTRKSDVYNTCVPLSAVHGQGAAAYVLAVRETETVLGLEQIAEKIPVTVQDSDASNAALSGALSTDDTIVTDGRAFADGARIRVQIP